jgi:hypothetical protein
MLDCPKLHAPKEAFTMDPAWRERLEAFERFNAWEAVQLRSQPPDYSAALEWVSEAWELADRIGSPEDPLVRRERHLRELLEMRAALARGGPRA